MPHPKMLVPLRQSPTLAILPSTIISSFIILSLITRVFDPFTHIKKKDSDVIINIYYPCL